MSPKSYTTREAAAAVGITRATLQAWIKARKVRAPKPMPVGGGTVRLWNESEVTLLRKVKERIYLKSRGRPKKKA